MNKKTLKLISNLIISIQQIKYSLEDVLLNEYDINENRPEGLQYSAESERLENAILHLEETTSSLNNAVDELESID